jgi:hypothetical protein
VGLGGGISRFAVSRLTVRSVTGSCGDGLSLLVARMLVPSGRMIGRRGLRLGGGRAVDRTGLPGARLRSGGLRRLAVGRRIMQFVAHAIPPHAARIAKDRTDNLPKTPAGKSRTCSTSVASRPGD